MSLLTDKRAEGPRTYAIPPSMTQHQGTSMSASCDYNMNIRQPLDNNNISPHALRSVGGHRLAFSREDINYSPDDVSDSRPFIITCMNNISCAIAQEHQFYLLGVTFDGYEYNGLTTRTGADVIVEGVVTLFVDPDAFRNARPDDAVYFSYEPSGVCFSDIPGQESVRLSVEPPHQPGERSMIKQFQSTNDNEYTITRDEYEAMFIQKLGRLVSYRIGECTAKIYISIF